MTKHIPKKILKKILERQQCILTPTGKIWNSYPRDKHLCFTGETVYEVVAPDNTEFVVSVGLQDKRPLIIKH